MQCYVCMSSQCIRLIFTWMNLKLKLYMSIQMRLLVSKAIFLNQRPFIKILCEITYKHIALGGTLAFYNNVCMYPWSIWPRAQTLASAACMDPSGWLQNSRTVTSDAALRPQEWGTVLHLAQPPQTWSVPYYSSCNKYRPKNIIRATK